MESFITGYLNTTTIPSATTIISYFSQGPPPTGPEIVGWCYTNYNLYYSRFATSTSTTSTTHTGTVTYLHGASTVTTSYTLDYPIFSTLVPTPYSAPPECVRFTPNVRLFILIDVGRSTEDVTLARRRYKSNTGLRRRRMQLLQLLRLLQNLQFL